jgi:hypothetical protein
MDRLLRKLAWFEPLQQIVNLSFLYESKQIAKLSQSSIRFRRQIDGKLLEKDVVGARIGLAGKPVRASKAIL